MNRLDELVLKNDIVQAKAYLDGYNFYLTKAMRAENDRKLANEYFEKFQELVARKREFDLVEALKEYAIGKGITHVDYRGLTIHITSIKV